MVRTNRGFSRQSRIARRLAGLGLTSVALAACVSSATPIPQPTSMVATPPAGTDSGPTAALPTLHPAPTPAGQWTSIEWRAITPAGFQAHPAATVNPDGTGMSTEFAAFGWSRGYVSFRSTYPLDADGSPLSTQIVPAVSADGINWTESSPLDMSGLDKDEGLGFVVEGPAGLLAVGFPPAATCGGPNPINALWLSPDGATWKRVTSPQFYSMDAGPAGYIATDLSTKVWTSTDAKTWHQVDMSKSVKGILVQDATAFSGGFVVAASVGVMDSDGCGGGDLKTPSLWWSGDGGGWTRDQLADAPVGADSWSSVRVINHNALLAIGQTYDEKTQESKYQAWTSTDGKNWSAYSDARVANGSLMTDGKNGWLISGPDDKGLIKAYLFDSKLALVELAQTGEPPSEGLTNGDITAGRDSLLVSTKDGSKFWLGTPKA